MAHAQSVESLSLMNTCSHDTRVEGAFLPLAFLTPGESACISKVRGTGDLHRHLENLGFVEGAFVKVISKTAGNLIVEVKGTQVALDKSASLKIITR